MADPARLLAQRHGADLELLDAVQGADHEQVLLGDDQGVGEGRAVEAGHVVYLHSISCMLPWG